MSRVEATFARRTLANTRIGRSAAKLQNVKSGVVPRRPWPLDKSSPVSPAVAATTPVEGATMRDGRAAPCLPHGCDGKVPPWFARGRVCFRDAGLRLGRATRLARTLSGDPVAVSFPAAPSSCSTRRPTTFLCRHHVRSLKAASWRRAARASFCLDSSRALSSGQAPASISAGF